MTITSKNHTVSFIGHSAVVKRSEREIFNLLTRTITDLYQQGCRLFVCGMSTGFDLLAAEAILMHKIQNTDTRLMAVVSYEGQEKSYSADDKLRYAQIIARCDEKHVISSCSESGLCRLCCDYLVDNCSTLVTYFDDSQTESGTAYAISRAKDQSISVINLF